MAQRIDVRADVRAQGDGFSGRARSARIHVFAVLLAQAVEIGRMQRIVRHAGEIRLRQIDGAAAVDPAEKFGECGQVSSLLMIFIRDAFRVRLADRARGVLFASLLQILVQFAAGFISVGFRLMQSLLRIVLQLLGGLACLLAGAILIRRGAGHQRECKKNQGRKFHHTSAQHLDGQSLRVTADGQLSQVDSGPSDRESCISIDSRPRSAALYGRIQSHSVEDRTNRRPQSAERR